VAKHGRGTSIMIPIRLADNDYIINPERVQDAELGGVMMKPGAPSCR